MPMSAKEIISIVFAACFCFAATSGATAQEFSATSEALVNFSSRVTEITSLFAEAPGGLAPSLAR